MPGPKMTSPEFDEEVRRANIVAEAFRAVEGIISEHMRDLDEGIELTGNLISALTQKLVFQHRLRTQQLEAERRMNPVSGRNLERSNKS